jgi:UDP-N-acetylmuramoyl-L-alanyl-D-glutamate--2,6-diaminopimelate ligase
MVNTPTLETVLANISSAQVETDRSSKPVGPLRLDSRTIEAGDTFVAIEGFQSDGRIYIPMAVKQGANLILAEANKSDEFRQLFKEIAEDKVIWIADLRQQLSAIASNYYGHPSHELRNIAVTGTNGKTSCSYLIAKTLQKLSFECYLMGTLGVGCCGNLMPSNNTTADAITLQSILRDALNSGAHFSSMELSSHGIDQNRADAVQLNTAIFTNLTRDHLDYHGTMENYGAAKRKLFLHQYLKNVVLNMDDRFGRKLAKDEEITADKWLTTIKLPTSGSNLNRWIWAEDVNYSLRGIHAKIYTPWGSGKLDSPLIGQFNLSNLLLVVATLGAILKDLPAILEALKKVKAAEGRMHTIGNSKTPIAIVDYAHTPDALEKALVAIREHSVGLIWCVFGCGGDRDTGKRSLMAKIAEKLSNRVIVTQDNPRTESEESIRSDIFEGFKKPEKARYISDRKEAIAEAINSARPEDAILIAGKGHEDYQLIGKIKNHHSDIETCKSLIEEYQS